MMDVADMLGKRLPPGFRVTYKPHEGIVITSNATQRAFAITEQYARDHNHEQIFQHARAQCQHLASAS